ncbi:TrmJ/YjtD family RNA methyltransferase [Candidatus Woesearchaeota archaeon]|nr:TrmJ/YjtD family RNA methyltransferase [Candidatus Woesearchaeota archaeon]
MISVVLIEPETSGNIGAIARVMKNFEFDDLVIINPKCKPLAKEALDRATHAKSILKKSKIKKINYLRTFDYLLATTAILGTDYNIPRSPISPEQLAEKLSKISKKLRIGLLIGREGTGLSNKEISMCDFIVTIPSSKKYPTMNVSHATSIILYEISKKQDKKKSSEHIIFATRKEKDVILGYMNKIFNKLTFSTKEKKETQKKVWKRIIGKSFLTKREAFAVMGFLRKLGKI